MREYVLWLQVEVLSIQYLVFQMRVLHCNFSFLYGGHVVLATSGVKRFVSCVVVCV